MPRDADIPHADITYRVIGCAMRVQGRLGPGLPVGLLFNFGRKRLEFKRILRPKDISAWQEHARRYAWRPPSGPPENEKET